MNYTLENEKIKIGVRSYGGEITSIFSKITEDEYLWNGDPKYWKYHAPILFPIVGKVFNNEYRVDGKVYTLPQHGLARISEFEMVDISDSSITFELKYNKETLKVYPYKFVLRSTYEIIDNVVKVKYTVENLDNKNIYFSIGAHPAFMCPIKSNETLEDYYIEFDKDEKSDRLFLLGDGYISQNKEPLLDNQKILNLNKELFERGALIFDDLKSDKITLRSKNSDNYLEVDFEKFPYMGIWSPEEGAPFVCIEPWYGLADKENYNGEFSNKKGIIDLDINDTFSCTFTVKVK